jgi:hypothetical protein
MNLDTILKIFNVKPNNKTLENARNKIFERIGKIPKQIIKENSKLLDNMILDIAKLATIIHVMGTPVSKIEDNYTEFTNNKYRNKIDNDDIKYLKGALNYYKSVVAAFIKKYNNQVKDPAIALAKMITKNKKLPASNKLKLKSLNTKNERNQINKKDLVNANIKISAEFQISEEIVRRYMSIMVENEPKNKIIDIIKQRVADYINEINNYGGQVVKVKYQLDKIENQFDMSTFEISDLNKMPLRHTEYIKLPYNIKANDAIVRQNCVYDLIENIQKKYNIINKWEEYKILNEIDEDTEWSVESTVRALNELNISHKIYSQFGDLLSDHTYNKNTYVYLIFANEHVYHVDKNEIELIKDYIKSVDIQLNKLKITDIKLNEHDIKYYMDNHQVKNVKLKVINTQKNRLTYDIANICVANRVNGDEATIYVDQFTMDAYNLYKNIGVDVILSAKFNFLTPLEFIAKKYNLYSTMTSKWNKPIPVNMAINETKIQEMYDLDYDGTDDLDIISVLNHNGYEVHSIDLNKAYSACITELTFIPIVDAECESYKYNKQKIKNRYFYVVEEVHEHILGYVNVGIHSGYRLKCFDKKYYKISHYIIPKIIQNPFKKIIPAMIEKDPKLAKEIINRFYGNMQHNQNESIKKYPVPVNIFKSKEEVRLAKGAIVQEIDGCYVAFKQFESNKKYNKNMIPFAHFIVDKCISKIMNTIKELGVKIQNIIEIKTDCITYIGEKADFELNPNTLGGFKEIEPKLRKNDVYGCKRENKFNLPTITKYDITKNILGYCYAGSGKTHFIKNNIIPKLVKRNLRYMVVCSHWQPIVEYKKFTVGDKEYKAPIYTIQHLESVANKGQNMMKRLNVLIVDECGLLTYKQWEFITLNIPISCKLVCFGDGKQLSPVDPGCKIKINPLDSITIQSLFDCKMKLKENYRNNYTIEDYDNMINGDYEPVKEKELFEKQSDYVICYRNDTRKKINEERTKNWVDYIEIEDKQYKIKQGAKIICRTNNLKKFNIYNKQMFDVVSYDGILKLVSHFDNNDQYEIPLEMYKDFDIAEALTLYCVQGWSIPLDKISFADIKEIKSIKGGLYTALSRIKGELP